MKHRNSWVELTLPPGYVEGTLAIDHGLVFMAIRSVSRDDQNLRAAAARPGLHASSTDNIHENLRRLGLESHTGGD